MDYIYYVLFWVKEGIDILNFFVFEICKFYFKEFEIVK